MSWSAVLVLCASAYALKALGLALAERIPSRGAGGSLEMLVVPVLAALIVVQTVGGERQIVLDARLPAVLVAGVLVWRRAPILVIVLAAGAAAALLRRLA